MQGGPERAGDEGGAVPKRARVLAEMKIGTHNGTFHCDEALAVAMLRMLPQYRDAQVVRTRDAAVLKDVDVVVDVGGEYNPECCRFDHHQREFHDTFSEKHDIRLSSAGLVYKHYGKDVLGELLPGKSGADINLLYHVVYDSFIAAIDGIDNGVNQFESSQPPRYVNHTDLASRVSHLNPEWNESQDDIDDRFLKASELTGKEFKDAVLRYANSWLPARALVELAYSDRFKTHASGEIIKFESFCLWKTHIYEIESQDGCSPPTVKYVLYPDQSGAWRVQAVPVSVQSFESRLPLPEQWRGLRDDALSAAIGMAGCIFVHVSGFTGGHKTADGALHMAIRALELAQ